MNRRKRNVLLTAIICSLSFSFQVLAKASTMHKIATLAPRISYSSKRQIRDSALRCSVGVNTVLAIIKIESDFIVGAFNNKSNDYGLMQINQWHVDQKGLSVKRLITDIEYNMRHGCTILGWFVEKYGLAEGVARYNCGTKRKCIEWKAVKRYRTKVLGVKADLDNMDRRAK